MVVIMTNGGPPILIDWRAQQLKKFPKAKQKHLLPHIFYSPCLSHY